MLFTLCVTPVVSPQPQLCSSVAVRILCHKETNAGGFGRVVWTATQLALAGTSCEPESNISVPVCS